MIGEIFTYKPIHYKKPIEVIAYKPGPPPDTLWVQETASPENKWIAPRAALVTATQSLLGSQPTENDGGGSEGEAQ